MRKKYLMICLVIFNLDIAAQNVGIGTTTPHASALLDIKSNTQGILVPRTSTSSRIAIINPAKGLMIYDTTTASFWFHNGSAWTQIGTAANGWALTGNAGTDPASNFLGTTDNLPLRFKTNNTWSGELNPITGNVYLGLNAGQQTNLSNSNVAVGIDALRLNTDKSNLVAIGDSALYNNGTGATEEFHGIGNTAVGSNALYSNTIGSFNTANGIEALYSNTTAINNTAIGSYALFSQSFDNGGDVWESNNVAVGFEALYSNAPQSTVNGIGNTAVGTFALRNNTIGYDNTAIGASALYYNDIGLRNTAIGRQALFSNTFGSANTATGYKALRFNEDGDFNSAYGTHALYSNTSGNHNTAFGESTLFTNSDGSNNTATGYRALYNNNTGEENTANGFQALYYNNGGGYNTAIGYNALINTTEGHGNIAIGSGSGPSSTTYGNIFNSLTVGYNQVNNQSNQAVIGNTLTAFVGGYVNWTNYLSDGRYKKNVQENVKGLDFILQLRPVTYNLDIHGLNKILGVDDLKKTNHSLKGKDSIDLKQAEIEKIFEENIAQKESITYNGFIAQEVEQAAQKVQYNFSGVKKPRNENDNYGIAYSDFVVPLVKAIQEQQSIIEAQNKKIELLLKEMKLVKEQLNKMIDKSK